MTAHLGHPGEEPELDAYAVISRAREAVPRLATESLDRIHALLERALAGDRSGDGNAAEVVSEIARTLDRGA